MVKGKFLVSIVDEKFPFEKENTAQSKLVVSCAYCTNSELNRVRAFEPVSGREDFSCSNLPDNLTERYVLHHPTR